MYACARTVYVHRIRVAHGWKYMFGIYYPGLFARMRCRVYASKNMSTRWQKLNDTIREHSFNNLVFIHIFRLFSIFFFLTHEKSHFPFTCYNKQGHTNTHTQIIGAQMYTSYGRLDVNLANKIIKLYLNIHESVCDYVKYGQRISRQRRLAEWCCCFELV